jgi:hypothetical protein
MISLARQRPAHFLLLLMQAVPLLSQFRALYDFPGTNAGELGVSANEILQLVEDDGSGWVLCQRVS